MVSTRHRDDEQTLLDHSPDVLVIIFVFLNVNRQRRLLMFCVLGGISVSRSIGNLCGQRVCFFINLSDVMI